MDGSLRTLVLSVEDHVNFLDGRKVKHVQEYPRWVDAYKVGSCRDGRRMSCLSFWFSKRWEQKMSVGSEENVLLENVLCLPCRSSLSEGG